MKDSLRKLHEQAVVDALQAQAENKTRWPLLFPIAFMVLMFIVIAGWWIAAERIARKLEAEKPVPAEVATNKEPTND